MTTPSHGADPAEVDSDAQLMTKVIAGSVESFAELYDRYCDRAYRVAVVACRDKDRAQDAVQDGFLSIWNARASYRAERGTVAAWLLTVVRCRAIDIARSDSKCASRTISDDHLEGRDALSDPMAEAIRRDEAWRLQNALATLPDAQAEVIVLAYYGQLSHSEIAERIGVPSATVKGRMRLGLQKLRSDIHQATAL